MNLEPMPFLEKTKEHMEKSVGLTIEEMLKMDLCKIEKHLEKKPGRQTKPTPEVYRRTRGSTYTAMGRILTPQYYEKSFQRLVKKYL